MKEKFYISSAIKGGYWGVALSIAGLSFISHPFKFICLMLIGSIIEELL